MGDQNESTDSPPGPKAPKLYRLASRLTRIHRHSMARYLRIAAIGAIVTACPASIALNSLDLPLGLGTVFAFVLGSSPAALLIASLVVAQRESARAAEVSVTRSTLRLDRGTAGVFEVPLDAIESAFLREFGEGAEVDFVLRNRDVVRIDARTADEAHALVRLTGQEPSRRRAAVKLTHTGLVLSFWFAGLPSLIVGSMALVTVVIEGSLGAERSFETTIAIGLLSGLFAAALGAPTLRAYVEVGSDGITLRRAYRRRFMAFDELEQVEYSRNVLTFTMRNGSTIRCWATANREPSPGALVERIQQAWRCSRNGLKGDGVRVLAREGRDVASWKKALVAAIGGKDGYRGTGVSLDDLRRILGDASAPAEHRIAAALALSNSRDARDRACIRVAVDATASDRVRVAIANAAEGRLNEHELDDALREASASSLERR